MALDGKKVTFIHTLPQMKNALKYPTQSKKSLVYTNGKSMENKLLKEQIILQLTFLITSTLYCIDDSCV